MLLEGIVSMCTCWTFCQRTVLTTGGRACVTLDVVVVTVVVCQNGQSLIFHVAVSLRLYVVQLLAYTAQPTLAQQTTMCDT